MITVDWLKEHDACWFNPRPVGGFVSCSCGCGGFVVSAALARWDAKQPIIAAGLAWLGDGKTPREVLENKNISDQDRRWVFERLVEDLGIDTIETCTEACCSSMADLVALLGEDADQ